MKEDTTRKSHIQYTALGKGDPLIFIHGVGLDHTMWQQQLNYFSSDYQVYAYDMLGHGQSEKPETDFYKLEYFIKQLNFFMEMRHIESAHLVGFSMGGMVAQLFSILFPEKVKTLVLTNAVANRNEKERESVLNRVKLVEEKGKNVTIDAAIERWFNKDYQKDNPDIVAKIKKRLEVNDESAYLNAYRVFATADQEIWRRLEQVQAPTFIITGDNDKGSNPRMAKEMNEKIPDSEVYIVPKARHMLPIEKAEVFNKHVHDFLKRYKEVIQN